MTVTTTFASDKISLLDLLTDIEKGKIQLPDFQRGWVWDDQHIISVLASVARAFPIGTVMLLETGNAEIRFQTRLIEGVKLSEKPEAEKLILDGQQRLTSLFQALLSNSPVNTSDDRNKKIKRWYYIDIKKAINSSIGIEEAIVSLPENRKSIVRKKIEIDCSNQEKECEAGLFPLPFVFNNSQYLDWQTKYLDNTSNRSELLEIWKTFSSIIQCFQQYQVPIISLKKETPKEAICLVFEKVNTSGVSLTIFNLVTATFAADNYRLRDDWQKRQEKFKKFPVLENLENSDFLQIITLLATYDRYQNWKNKKNKKEKPPTIGCNRKDLLTLTLEEYKNWAESATEGLEKTAQFLHEQNVFSAYYLPYPSQLLPMSSILTLLGEKANSAGVKERIARWYWCGIFGELYGGASYTKINKDVPQVLNWINDKNDLEPDTIIEANVVPQRLISLRRRQSAAYKGIYALLLNEGGLDFATGTPISSAMYFDEKMDLHHIFPTKWCEKNNISSKRYNSIINKTVISAKTNKEIGGEAPSIYLPKLEQKKDINSEQMDDILKSHFIEPSLIRSDNFDEFFKARQTSLLNRIEKLMGKKISRDEN